MVRPEIPLDANSTVRVELELQPCQLTEVVQVAADANILQTARADTGGKIENQQLTTLPLLNNRNNQNTLMLFPGVQRTYRSNSPFFNSQEHLQSVVNGPDQKNNYTIEGIDNNIEGYMTAVVFPADAISSVDGSTTNYDPELGRAGGALMNVIMKSGTNNFHGSLFEYYRDSDLQARNIFATTVPHGVYNQFRGSLGRVVRDRLFIFGDYQGSRNVDGQTAIPTILTMPMRTGDFSASTTIIFDHNTGSSNGIVRSPFAAFLLDQPNSIGRDQAVIFPTNRDWAYNLCFQDRWQVTRELTMDLGLRWEYWPAGISQVGGYSSA